MPLVFMLSIIPDADMLIPILEHRGPTHSLIMSLIVFAPFFAVYRKKAIPYFAALIQHSLISDYVAGSRLRLLWPLTMQRFGTGMAITSITSVTVELVLFAVAMIIMVKAKDIIALTKPRYSNLILSIPTFTVLLPPFLSFPLKVPVSLMLPHLVYVILFMVSMISSLLGLRAKRIK